MSWEEYSGMFEQAQITGKYKCYVFDMKNSKHGYDIEKVFSLINNFKNKINKNAIHKIEGYENPFRISGDLIVLVVHKDSMSDDEVYQSFKDAKEEVGLQKEYHYISGYYETDNWAEGSDLYYFGYCIQELEYRSKLNKNLL